MRFLKGTVGRIGAISVVAALAMLAFASMAAANSPKGEYAQFKECPYTSNPKVNDCIYSVSSGGGFTIGKKEVPLKNPVTLQAGFEGEGSEIKVYGAETGNTLSKTPQPVPGGLLGITAPTWWPKSIQNWFNEQISKGFTGVNATVELAGPTKGYLPNLHLSTENLLFREGTALGLPAKIHLENSILGSNCYIGGDSKPVQIEFTTGKSGKIEGSVGAVTFNPSFTITTISGGKLVNNTFAAPGASGCGGIFSFLIDPLVNSIIGLPAGSGSNTAILQGVLQDAAAPAVKASE